MHSFLYTRSRRLLLSVISHEQTTMSAAGRARGRPSAEKLDVFGISEFLSSEDVLSMEHIASASGDQGRTRSAASALEPVCIHSIRMPIPLMNIVHTDGVHMRCCIQQQIFFSIKTVRAHIPLPLRCYSFTVLSHVHLFRGLALHPVCLETVFFGC